MDDATTQILTTLLIVAAFVVSLLATQFARRAKRLTAAALRSSARTQRVFFPLRRLPAYQTMPQLVGAAIEAGRPIHVSLGGAGIGGASTASALAATDLLYQLGRRAAIGASAGARTPTVIATASDPTAYPLAYSTLRYAAAERNKLGVARLYDSAQWYASGTRSLAFAGVLSALYGIDQAASVALAGTFSVEMALPLEAAARRRLPTLATSDQLEGQAVAYAMAERSLIGDEAFVPGAYLGNRASDLATALTIDALRYLVIAALLLAAVLLLGDVLTEGGISAALGDLLSGAANP